MNKSRNLEMTAATLRDYHDKALAFFRENLNPAVAQYFNKMRENSALLAIDSSAPTHIKNIQAILNIMLLAERSILIYSKSNGADLDEARDLALIANQVLLNVEHLEFKASTETRNLIAVLRNSDRISFQALTNTLPELAKLATEISGTGSTAIEKIGDFVSDVNIALNNSKENQPSSRQVFEGAIAVSAPDLRENLEAKDSEERYVLNPQADGEVLTSVKRIANSLDYLNEALNFKLNADKGQFFGGLVEGLVKYKEVIGAIYSLSPAILNTSEKMRTVIHGKARKLIPVLREAILSAIKIENETGLVPGYLLDQIIPFAKRYIEFANKIGMELSDDEKNLFISERQGLRKTANEDTVHQLNKTLQLKEKLDTVLSILNSGKALLTLRATDLETLEHTLPLLQLPEELAAKFALQIKNTKEGISPAENQIDDIDILAYEQMQTQEKVYDHVRKQLLDIEAHKNMLKSSIEVINFGRVDELCNNKSVAELNLEEAEFLQTHFIEHTNLFGFNTENFTEVVETTFDQIKNRVVSLKASAQQSPANKDEGIVIQPITIEDLAALSKDINSRNFKLADVAKEFRQFVLGNINAFFSESVVANFKATDKDGILEILPGDPKHIQDMKNLLSALTVLERTFRASETSYYSAITQASLLKDIASRFHLDYSQQMQLSKTFFGRMSTQAFSTGEELTTEIKRGLNLNESATSEVANAQQGASSYFDDALSYTSGALGYFEWAYRYIDFKPSNGSTSVDLKPYVEQMEYIKEQTELFLKEYFKEDFAKCFTPDEQGLYERQHDDTAIVRDAKTLLNALHHMAGATDDVNNYLQKSYFDLPAAVSSISIFVTSLNELDLTSTHSQLCDIKSRIIESANTYVNKKINPLLQELMIQGDRYEQSIGFTQGTLTNRIQPLVDIYQAQHENLGVDISLRDDNAFLEARHEERNQFLAYGEKQLSKLEGMKFELQKFSKQLPILKKWYNVLNGKNKSLSDLSFLKSVKRQINLLGDQKAIDEFSSIVETLIQNHEALAAGYSREVKLFDSLRNQIGIRYRYLQKSLPKELQIIEDQKASIRFRMAVIRDHQKTLAENAKKSEEAAIKSAEAREKAKEAQKAIDLIAQNSAEEVSKESTAIIEHAENLPAEVSNEAESHVEKAKRLSQEASELALEAQRLADESHLGVIKREAAEAKAEVREVERNFERKTAPPVAPEENENEHGFFMQILISVLKVIAELLDSFVFAVKMLFGFSPVQPKKEEQTHKRKSISESKDNLPQQQMKYSGDRLESEPTDSDTESADDSLEERENIRPKQNDANSYGPSRIAGFLAQRNTSKKAPSEEIPAQEDTQNQKPGHN